MLVNLQLLGSYTQGRSYFTKCTCKRCLLAFVVHVLQIISRIARVAKLQVNVVWHKRRTLGSQWTLLPKIL